MKKWKEMFIVVNKALEIAKIHKIELNNIIFLGGQTRIPKIEEMVKNLFGKIEILKSLNVEEVVEYGAAISGNQNLIIEYIISKSIDIEIANNKISKIIPMGIKLPSSDKIITYLKQFIVRYGSNRKIQKLKFMKKIIKILKKMIILEDLFLILKMMKNY